LRPGEYFVAAVTDGPPELWNEPAFLAALVSSAARASLTPTGTKPVDLIVR
jgi:hypothetical protein